MTDLFHNPVINPLHHKKMPNTMLDKVTDFVKFRNRISLFTKKLRLAQYADGCIYVHHLKIAQAQ